MGKGWRYESEWPLRRAVATRLAFAEHGSLVPGQAASGQDIWGADLTSSTLTAGANRWNFGVSTARRPLSLDGQEARRLVYTQSPLAADTEVTGHPIVDVVLSSSEADGDVFAYLEDVAPDGTSLLVTEGQLRANYYMPKSGGPVAEARPILPWHGYGKADYRAHPFAGGGALRLHFDMMPTSWLFRKGHRIRVSLAAADWPSFALHPDLSPANDPHAAGTKVPVWTLRRGPGLSGITLPVVPDGK